MRLWEEVLLFVVGVLGGSILGAILTLAWDFPRSLENATPLLAVGYAMTYAGFGAIPSLIFGLTAILFLKHKGYSLWPATAALTVGGGIVGGLLMFATFGMFRGFGPFEQLGATAGASIGFMLGLLLFARSSAAKT